MLAAVLAALALTAATPSHIAFSASRTPTSFGEIYRVAPNGAVTNLTHNPAADVDPSVSPNGKLVAFARLRATTAQIYVVGTDGRGLHAVSPRIPGAGLHDGAAITIAWSPDNRHFSVLRTSTSTVTLALDSTTGGYRSVARGLSAARAAWSHDGRRIAVSTAAGLVDVLDSSTGRLLWKVAGQGTSDWSSHGLLAVHAASDRVVVYDASGHKRAAFPGDTFAWSGTRLASLLNGLLQLRPTGVGEPTVSVRVTPKGKGYDGGIAWAGPNFLHVRAGDGVWRGYDFAHHRKLPGFRPFDTVYSSTGEAASIDYTGKQLVKLLRGTKTVARFPQCNDDTPVENVQYVAHTSALVYQTGCGSPSEDIYSVTPAGTALRRLTHTPTDEFAPTFSPDGSKVAYSVQAVASFCKGCPHDLWVSGARLTQHSPDEDTPFDDLPSYSPDGKQIVFVRSGSNTPPTLYTIPVGGGAARGLALPYAWAPAWGAKGIAFVKGYRPSQIAVVDPTTSKSRSYATVKTLDVRALAWSHDGRLAYLAADPKGRTSITIAGGKSIRLPVLAATGLAWSPDDKRFAFVGADANGWGEVFTIGADGKGLHQVTRNLGVIGTVSWR